jgi:hypothetical protein
MFLHSIGKLSMYYTGLYPRRQNASLYFDNLAMWSKMNFIPKFHHYHSFSCHHHARSFLSCLFNKTVSIKSNSDRQINECGTMREMRIGRRNRSTWRKCAPVELVHHISHLGFNPDSNGGRPLTSGHQQQL